jgi:hypothetical protein
MIRRVVCGARFESMVGQTPQPGTTASAAGVQVVAGSVHVKVSLRKGTWR